MTESLALRLRQETKQNHTEAERSGIMRRLLTRTLDQPTYVALLRNLLPVYEALEEEMTRHQDDAVVAPFHHPGLARSEALRQDLDYLGGSGWRDLPVLPETQAYVQQIHAAARRDPALLVAHAYVRYLGDLSGGQILKKIIAESFKLTGGEGVSFYEFPALGDVDAFKHRYRAALDALAPPRERADSIVQEAIGGFQANSRLFTGLETVSA
ncbi:MAG TPA: biliverdin-producing heme oxygenase [Gemmatimonadales bacterium]|nr:biliverdin-producing heme oxygenase [Gemmatimonadales bacterium]